MKSAEVMSSLSRMWHSLSYEQKFDYIRVATDLSRDWPSPRTPPPPPPVVTQPNEEVIEELRQWLQFNPLATPNGFPIFAIVPRRSSGVDAALASRHLISEHAAVPPVMD
jgi:hypothetical protein